MPNINGVRIHLGPVSSAAARSWTDQMLQNLQRLREDPAALPFLVPVEVADAFERLLRTWSDLSDGAPEVEWVEDLPDDEVTRLVQYWANLDSLSDEQVAALGLAWAPAEARPFFEALAAAVATALADAGRPQRFAELLVEHGARPVRDARTTA